MKKILPFLLFSFFCLFVGLNNAFAQDKSTTTQTTETLTEFDYMKFSTMLNDMDKILKSGSAKPDYLQASIRLSSPMRTLALEQ